eukprot:CCRYP_016247-RA/>CCRYP_016247-RA protein AED:0.14 eAED:0.14 QI:0/-1/0/1/-1/1/1/0/157
MPNLSNTNASFHPSTRVVSFSPTSTLILIDYPSLEDKKSLWYSKEDFDMFKLVLARDISNCSELIEDATSGLLSDDDSLHCIGLESFVSRGMAQHIAHVKKNHLYRILFEQARQRYLNAYNADALARVSTISSRWSRRRSRAIAVRLMVPSGGRNVG